MLVEFLMCKLMTKKV